MAMTPDEIRAYKREWMWANRDEIRAYKREWTRANREKLRAQSHARYIKNREKIQAQSQARYIKNREKIRENAKKYYEVNKGKILEHNREYQKNTQAERRRAARRKHAANPELYRRIKRDSERRCRAARRLSTLLDALDHFEKETGG